jgi:hypothetical protein
MIQRSDESMISRSFSVVGWIRLLAYEMYRYLLFPRVFPLSTATISWCLLPVSRLFFLCFLCATSPPSLLHLLAQSVGVPACPWIYYSHKPVRRRTEGGRRRAGSDFFIWLQVMVGSLFSFFLFHVVYLGRVLRLLQQSLE